MSKKSKLTSSLNSLFWIGVCLLNIACAQRKPSIAIGNTVKKPSTEAPKPPASNPGETPSNSYPEFLLPHVKNISFGAILPSTALITVKRAYRKKLVDAIETLTKGRIRYNFPNHYRISDAQLVLISLNPSPTEVLNTLCELVRNVSTIIYMTNSEVYGHNAASTQYLMQLTGYLGIPVIAWNADNTGFHHSVSETRILQLAPSLEHQASAILSILQRYSWRSFSIVTGDIGGHNDFVRAVRDQLLTVPDLKFTILDILNVKARQRQKIKEKLEILAKSEARVVLLYSSKRQAQDILAVAKMLNLTGRNYMWIGTQSVVGLASEYFAPDEYLPGMLGIHFNTTHSTLLDEMEKAVTIFGNGLENFVNDGQNLNLSLTPSLTCDGSGVSRWHKGDVLYRYLRNVSIPQRQGKGNIEFNVDGTLKFVELEVMNLNENYYWERIGVWTKDGLEVKDITWPDKSPVPPQGVPERFSLRVSFLEEPSFVNYVPIDEATGKCKTSRAVKCRYAPSSESLGINKTGLRHGYDRCCSGFCIDLLQKFATDLKFNYELRRVEDGTWGALNNGTWNGLIADLLNNKADVVATSIKINSDRQKYVEFTVPFLETGITILVAKRTGIISPKAFLEPFDVVSWIMILLISIQVAAFAIFLFEWLSPSGYNMRMKPTRDHKFSLFRTYWLVWAILFGAAVPVNCPRGYTARFMSNVWATFAVVFLAIYTANLAAFMITREDFYDFTGLDDPRLANPHHTVPPLKFGTIPHGNTESVLKRNKPKMQAYMQKYNRSSSLEGVKAVKKGELDAFIYDAVVLDYLTGQDTECRLLTVGSWYAMTGYGFAFPKKSKYLAKFNEKMIEYRENGDLERLRKFWFQGACKPSKRKGKLSKPLDVNQFMSAFLLLGCGVLLTVLLLGLEHFYFRYCRRYLSKTDKDGCFTLVSLSMANSLTFQTAVVETQEMAKEPCCSDPVCSNHIWRLRKELDLARERLREYQESERTTEELLQQPSINHELKLCTKEDLDLDCQKSPYWALPCFSAYNPPSGNPQVLHRSRDITRNRVQTNDTQVKDSVSRYQQDTSHGPCKGTTTPEGKCLRGMFSKAAVAEIETVL